MLDVDLVEDALAARLLEARLELGPEQVDLAVQDPPPVRDLELLFRQIVDQLLEVGVRQRAEIGERFHMSLSSGGGSASRQADTAERVNLSLRLRPPPL